MTQTRTRTFTSTSTFGRTLAIIKPDAQESTRKIIDEIACSGFRIVVQKKMSWTTKMAAEFYQEHATRPFFRDLTNHMCGQVTVLVLEKGPDVVAQWRELMGATDPAKAAEGTIRKMFAKPGDPIYKNVVHGSDSVQSAKREIQLLFTRFELLGK